MMQYLPRLKLLFTKKWFHCLIIIMVGCLAYSNSMLNDFLLDDYIDLLGPSGVSHKTLKSILTQFQGTFYRPLAPIFYWVCFKAFGYNPFGYHLANLFLLLLISLSFYYIVCLLSEDVTLPFLSSFLFSLHPFQGMLVNYSVASAISIYIIAMQLAFIFFLWFQKLKKNYFYLLSLFFFLLSLMAHEISFVFPLFIVLVLVFLSEEPFKKIIFKSSPFFILAGLYFIFRMMFYSISHTGQGLFMMLPHIFVYLISVLDLVFWYVSKLIYPVDILFLWSHDMPYQLFKISGETHLSIDFVFNWVIAIKLLCGFFLLVGIICIFLRFKKGLRIFSLSLLLAGFIPALFASYNYFPSVRPFIEPHWFYFSSMGFYILLSSFIMEIKKKMSFLFWFIFVFFISFGYFFSTVSHNTYWRSQETYCRYWISLNKNNNTPYQGLAYSLMEKENYQEAVYYFKEGLKAGFDINARMMSSLGYAFYLSGKKEAAFKYLNLSLEMDPYYVETHHFFGKIFIMQGRLAEAQRAYENAVILDPNNKEYPKYLALIDSKLQ